MRSRLPLNLLLCAVLTAAFANRGQSQSTSSDPRVRYTKVREFFIPFQADPKRSIKDLRLYAQRNGGEWEYLTSAQPSQKGFNFFGKQDGAYGLTVQTVFDDGSKDPPQDQLRAELRVVIDTAPPKIDIRPFSTPDGSAGVEWDILDDNLDVNSIRLEYRWQGMVDWAPIDRGVQLRGRDQRTWQLKPEQKIEIRVRAMDLAKNEAVSAGVFTSPNIGDHRQFGGGSIANGSSTGGATATGDQQTANPPRQTQHFVNSTIVKLNYHVTVGPSGVKKVTLWRLDDNKIWSKVLEKDGADLKANKEAPAVLPGEKARTEPLTLIDDVKKDGVYGYVIVVESRAGASGRDPRPGDLPHSTVIVDTTPPVVKISEPKVRPNGTVAQGALVDISWTATDKNMAAAPITLEYAEKPDGTWRVIAEKIENTGRYTWAVPPTEPYSFYVRVKAVDRAGNMGQDQSKQNVVVDLTVPQVEIRDVAPVTTGGRPER